MERQHNHSRLDAENGSGQIGLSVEESEESIAALLFRLVILGDS